MCVARGAAAEKYPASIPKWEEIRCRCCDVTAILKKWKGNKELCAVTQEMKCSPTLRKETYLSRSDGRQNASSTYQVVRVTNRKEPDLQTEECFPSVPRCKVCLQASHFPAQQSLWDEGFPAGAEDTARACTSPTDERGMYSGVLRELVEVTVRAVACHLWKAMVMKEGS